MDRNGFYISFCIGTSNFVRIVDTITEAFLVANNMIDIVIDPAHQRAKGLKFEQPRGAFSLPFDKDKLMIELVRVWEGKSTFVNQDGLLIRPTTADDFVEEE